MALIIWKDGNKYAKDWIELTHRPMAQGHGYDIGFTFRGHYKAVECDAILPALEANGIADNATFFDPANQGMVLGSQYFREWWNAFADVGEDLSPQFVENQCISECHVPPCSDQAEDYPVVSNDGNGNSGGAVFTGQVSAIVGAVVFVFGMAMI